MAVRRTYKQKQQAQIKREEQLQYSLPATPKTQPQQEVSQSASSQVISQAEPSIALKLFGYDPKLVYNDLRRTLFATGVVISILLVVFFLTR